MAENEGDSHPNRARWLDRALMIGVSILTSAVATTWTISSTLANINADIAATERRLANLELENHDIPTRLATIEANQKNGQVRGDERDQRLVRIETKLDKVIDDIYLGRRR